MTSKNRKMILGYRVNKPTTGTFSYRNLAIQVGHFLPANAATEMAAALGRGNFDYLTKKAAEIAELSGGPEYLEPIRYSQDLLELTWQDDDGTPLGGGSRGPGRNHWYGLHIDRMAPTLEMADLLRKIIRKAEAGDDGNAPRNLRDCEPRYIVALLKTLGAVPVRYLSLNAASGVWVQDAKFSLDTAIPLPAAPKAEVEAQAAAA